MAYDIQSVIGGLSLVIGVEELEVARSFVIFHAGECRTSQIKRAFLIIEIEGTVVAIHVPFAAVLVPIEMHIIPGAPQSNDEIFANFPIISHGNAATKCVEARLFSYICFIERVEKGLCPKT